MKATKKILAALISVLLILSIVPMAAFAEDTPVTYVRAVALAVYAPVDGEKISFESDIDVNEKCTVTEVKWNNVGGYITDEEYAYVLGETYTVTVVVTANDGYKFSNLEATINNNEPDDINVDEDGKIATIQYSFECGSSTDEPIDEPDTPDEPVEPSFFDTVIEKVKGLLAGALNILLQTIRHIAGF